MEWSAFLEPCFSQIARHLTENDLSVTPGTFHSGNLG